MSWMLKTRIALGFLLLAAAPASAADLRVKAPVRAAPVQMFNWTGFYLGGHGGWAWVHKQWHHLSGIELANYSANGALGGGQIGYNWRTGDWVIGAEAQASFGHIRQGVCWTDPDPQPVAPTTCGRTVPLARLPRIGTTVEHLGTVAARFGRAFDRSLIYVKGGAAWAHDVYRVFNPDLSANEWFGEGTRWGWMVGVGYEYAFQGNWSAKVEFNYLGLGDKRITVVNDAAVLRPVRQYDVGQDIALVKVGVNYRFGLR